METKTNQSDSMVLQSSETHASGVVVKPKILDVKGTFAEDMEESITIISNENAWDADSKTISNSDSRHCLCSTQRGESNIEKVASRIEERRVNRIPVTFEIRKFFLKTCETVAQRNGFKNKIHYGDLIELRDDFKARVEAKEYVPDLKKWRLRQMFGVWDKDATMLTLLEKGVSDVKQIDSNWFHFRDFNFYFMVVVPKWRLFKSATLVAFQWLLIFYFCSGLLFCVILNDEDVCPEDPTGRDRPYYGWLTTIYFASATMSTVGYGDVTMSIQESWRGLVGILYMFVSILMGYTVVATAAGAALSGFGLNLSANRMLSRFFKFLKEDDHSVPLYKQVRRVLYIRMAELILYFVIFNLTGMLVAYFFFWVYDLEEEHWPWVTYFYWAVQTTTTIGYGDLDMPFELRWFQIFYTTFGTALVGSVFGRLASLKNDISDLRRYYAWKRREVSKRLFEDMKGIESDHKLDQFEFMVGSLLMLKKIDRDDVEQIMDKYRELAGEEGYIMHSQAQQGEKVNDEIHGSRTTMEKSEDSEEDNVLRIDLEAEEGSWF